MGIISTNTPTEEFFGALLARIVTNLKTDEELSVRIEDKYVAVYLQRQRRGEIDAWTIVRHYDPWMVGHMAAPAACGASDAYDHFRFDKEE